MFYRISANYIGKYKGNSEYFEKGDSLYIDVDKKFPLITFSIATPLGGPVFETRINNGVLDKSYVIDWNQYKNCILLTDGPNLRKLDTAIHKIIDLSAH